MTSTVPIYDGHVLPHAIQRLERLAGRDVTDQLTAALVERGYSFAAAAEQREVVRDIKDKLACVAQEYDDEAGAAAAGAGAGAESSEVAYELPDGTRITVGSSERFQCAEVLFQPAMLCGMEAAGSGIHEALFRTINKCDLDMCKFMYANVVLAGGTTLLLGFAERLGKELVALAPTGTTVEVVAPPERAYSEWTGGALLASLSTFASTLITKAKYDEAGPTVVHRLRC